MNQTVKIFFTDMDDTLLNSEKQVTKEKHGCHFRGTCCRPQNCVQHRPPALRLSADLKELGLDREGCYAIAFNGGLIYDCAAKKTLYRRTIPLEYARVIFEKNAGGRPLLPHLLRHLPSLPPCRRGNARLHTGNPHSRRGRSASAGAPRRGTMQDDRD